MVNKHKPKINTKSNKPYILDMSSIFKKNDEILMGDDERLKNDKKLFEAVFGKNDDSLFSPLSGSETDYDPVKWNKNDKIRTTNNCFSYAVNKFPLKTFDSKSQPGLASGYKHLNDYKCKYFKERIQKDVPSAYIETFDNRCIPGFYKIFLTYGDDDYHFYKQNSDGYWSDKPGSTDVHNVDASNKRITNPAYANRNYESLNYDVPCFYACVYSDLSRSIDKVYGTVNNNYL